MTSTPPPPSAERPIGVVGGGALARSIAEELRREGRAFEEFGAPPTGDRLGELACLVLADDDDAGNVDAALHARQRQPKLPLVVRVFDPVLEEYLSRTSPEISILSMSGTAMPALIELVGDAPVSTVGLASWFRAFKGKLDGLLLGALAVVGLLALAGTLFFQVTMGLSLVDAFYFVVVTITTTGYGDITPKDQSAKLAATGLMLLGTLTIAILFALISEWVFARRLDVVMGRLPTRWSNHVVLVGAGNMTARLAGLLHQRGQRAIVIERSADNPLIPVVRAQGHQVLVADATKEQILLLAGVDRARSLLVFTEVDAHNLHIALVGRSLSKHATICARIDSPSLSAHVTATSSILATSPLLVAARAFAEEALDRAARGGS